MGDVGLPKSDPPSRERTVGVFVTVITCSVTVPSRLTASPRLHGPGTAVMAGEEGRFPFLGTEEHVIILT